MYTYCTMNSSNESSLLSMLIRVEVNKFWKGSCNCWQEKEKIFLLDIFVAMYFNAKGNYVSNQFWKSFRKHNIIPFACLNWLSGLKRLRLLLLLLLTCYFKQVKYTIVGCLFTKLNRIIVLCSICNCSNLKSSRLYAVGTSRLM